MVVCSIEGCGYNAHARGLCATHNWRVKKYGDPFTTTKHNKSNTKEYRAWNNMRQRCSSKTHQAYPKYGGRGIEVCERWSNFNNFLDDMGIAPTAKHSIERRDNDGDYSPTNCYWATYTQQNNNRRNTRFVTIEGITKPLSEWRRELQKSRYIILKLGLE